MYLLFCFGILVSLVRLPVGDSWAWRGYFRPPFLYCICRGLDLHAFYCLGLYVGLDVLLWSSHYFLEVLLLSNMLEGGRSIILCYNLSFFQLPCIEGWPELSVKRWYLCIFLFSLNQNILEKSKLNPFGNPVILMVPILIYVNIVEK